MPDIHDQNIYRILACTCEAYSHLLCHCIYIYLYAYHIKDDIAV